MAKTKKIDGVAEIKARDLNIMLRACMLAQFVNEQGEAYCPTCGNVFHADFVINPDTISGIDTRMELSHMNSQALSADNSWSNLFFQHMACNRFQQKLSLEAYCGRFNSFHSATEIRQAQAKAIVDYAELKATNSISPIVARMANFLIESNYSVRLNETDRLRLAA